MKIYQIIDANGEETTYFKEKPRKMLKGNEYDGYDYTDGFLFPIPLKPLQIAEITVNEDGERAAFILTNSNRVYRVYLGDYRSNQFTIIGKQGGGE